MLWRASREPSERNWSLQRSPIPRRPREVRAFTALTFALLLAGCMVGPNYQRPAIDAPGVYRADSQASIASSESLGDEKWWEVFQDPLLQQLIRTAMQQNYDVRIAAAR